jgi:putative ABC transport system permease protein
MTDLRAAWRALIAAPMVSLVVLCSLALGIGANTAVFSVVDAALLRPLPVPAASRLVSVVYADQPASVFPVRVWEDLRTRDLADLFAWMRIRSDLNTGGETQFVDGMAVSGNLFGVLGLTGTAGRLLTEDDDQPAASAAGAAAVVSHGFAQRQFGSPARAVGATITLDRRSYRIVGVTPPSFDGLHVGVPFEFAIPLAAAAIPNVRIMGRLTAGQTPATATARLRALQPLVREATMSPYASASLRESYLRTPLTVRSTPGGVSALRLQYERPLYATLAVVAIVLLIACVNIAAVLLAQAALRRREWAIRTALGASRLRLAWQVWLESAVLAAGGAAAGLAIAQFVAPLVIGQLSNEATVFALDVNPDRRVLAFTAVVAVITAMLFGTLPAFRATQASPLEAIKDGAGSTVRSGGAGYALMAAQMALCVVLVIAAGSFGRALLALAAIDPGFDPDSILVATIDARRSGLADRERLTVYERIREAVATVASVEHAAMSDTTPASDRLPDAESFETADGRLLASGGEAIWAYRVGPGWFQTLGIQLVAGRDVQPQDRAGAPAVAVVNETFAARLQTAGGAPGQTIMAVRSINPLEVRRTPITIVGVVRDAARRDLRERPAATIYLPIAQYTSQMFSIADIAARTSTPDARSTRQAIAAAVQMVNPAVSITFRALDDRIDSQLAHHRLLAGVSGAFGALALLLATVGAYGLTAGCAARRRREIGIRLALGADATGIAALVMRRAVLAVALGGGIGVIGGLWLARLAGSPWYGVEPGDPATIAGALATIAFVALLATWRPARRAGRSDPVMLLRSDT